MSAEFLFYANLAIIVVFAIGILWVYNSYKNSCGKQLDNLKDRLHAINDSLAKIPANDPLYSSGVNRKNIRDAFANDEEINLLWKLFDNTIVEGKRNTANGVYKVFYSTADVENYINYASVSNSVNIGFWQNIGGIFTGIGIFGTFVGLTMGLIYVGAHEINVESMKVLMEGLGTAFSTSLLGVLAALVFNYHHKNHTEGLKNEVDKTVKYIELLFTRITSEQLLADMFENEMEQTSQIQTLSTKLAASIREELTKSDFAENMQNVDNEVSNIREFLQNELSTIINESIKTQLEPVFRDLQDSIVKLSSSGLDAVAEGIQNSAGKELGAFATTLQSLNDSISDTLTELKSTSGNVKTDLNDSISSVIAKLDNSIERIIEQTDLQSKSLQGTSNDVTGELKTCVEQILEKISKQHEDTISTNEGLLKKTQEEMGNILASMQANVSAISQETANQREALEGTTNKISAEIQSSLQASLASIESTVRSMADQAKTQQDNIEKVSDNVGKALESNMSATISAMAQQVSAIKEQTASQIAGIKEQTSAQQETLIATGKSVNNAISESMETIKKQVVEIMESYNTKNKEANDNIINLINRLKSDLLVQQDALRKINTTVSNLIGKASDTADKFGKAADPIEKASNNLSVQLQKTIDAATRYNTNVATGIEKLKSIAESNTNGIKDISSEFEKTRKGMQDVAEEYKGVNTQISAILRSVDTSLKGYNTQVIELFKKSLDVYAKEIAKACGHLASITEELTDAIDEKNMHRR